MTTDDRPDDRSEESAEETAAPSPIEARAREIAGDSAQSIEYSFDELELRVPRDAVVDVCAALKSDPDLDFKYLRCLSVVDWQEELEAVYHLASLSHPHKMVVKTRAPSDDPWIPTMIGVWMGADWHEREGHDLFGLEFRGHPDLSPLILYEGFEGFPGRKDYEIPEQVTFYGD